MNCFHPLDRSHLSSAVYCVATDPPQGSSGLLDTLAHFLSDDPSPSNFPGSRTRAGARWGPDARTLYKTNILGLPLTPGCLASSTYFWKRSTSLMTPVLLRARRASRKLSVPGDCHLGIGKDGTHPTLEGGSDCRKHLKQFKGKPRVE